MLDALRNGAKTWFAKLLIALLVMSFAVWGVADIFGNFNQNVVAEVGDTEISAFSFETAYRRQLDTLGRQIGRPLSTSEGAAFGVPGQVLGQLVAEAALNEAASSLKLGISDQQLVKIIQNDPAFQNPGGGYDRNRLAQLLAANGVSEDNYVIERRQLAERQQLAEGLAGSLTAPAPYLEAFFIHQNEERTIRYLNLGEALVGDIPQPSEEELTTYFADNQSEYRAPEFRQVALLSLTPENIVKPEDVSDEAARERYEASTDRFAEPEKRKILQMSFPSKADAEAAAAELAEGKTFTEILADQSMTEEQVDLGFMAKADLLDPAVAEAAFSLAEGKTSGVVDGRFGSIILKVSEIRPAQTRAFSEVEATLKNELALETARQEVLDLHDTVEDARAGGATLQEVSERFSLPLETPAAFDATGVTQDGETVSLPEAEDLLNKVFDADIGLENDALPLGRDGFLWYEVTDITPERDQTLDEVRQAVIEAWTGDQQQQKLKALAENSEQELKDGKPLTQLADALGVTVQTSAPFKRAAQVDGLSSDAVQMAFSGPKGFTATTPGENGDYIVLEVAEVSQPAFFREAEDVANMDVQLSESLQNSIIGAYVAEVETRVGVEINQPVLLQITGTPSGS